jgi:cobalamin synthase
MHVVGSFAFALVIVIPLWRIYARVGLPPALALIVFVPYLGIFLAAAILAFSEWRGARAGDIYGAYQPDLFDGKPR